MLSLLLFLFPVVAWSLGFFCSSVNPTASLNSISSLLGLGVEICLYRSSVGGQEHVKGQAGGRVYLKASSG